jgi:hypothetical protein
VNSLVVQGCLAVVTIARGTLHDGGALLDRQWRGGIAEEAGENPLSTCA